MPLPTARGDALRAAADLIDLLPRPLPPAVIRVTDRVEVEFPSAGSTLGRVLAIALLAHEIGDEDGPRRTAVGRTARGTFKGVDVFAYAYVSPSEQDELEQIAREVQF